MAAAARIATSEYGFRIAGSMGSKYRPLSGWMGGRLTSIARWFRWTAGKPPACATLPVRALQRHVVLQKVNLPPK